MSDVSLSMFVGCNDVHVSTDWAPYTMLHVYSFLSYPSMYSLDNLDSISRKNINTTTYQQNVRWIVICSFHNDLSSTFLLVSLEVYPQSYHQRGMIRSHILYEVQIKPWLVTLKAKINLDWQQWDISGDDSKHLNWKSFHYQMH